jgi:phosphoglycolate phosphatase
LSYTFFPSPPSIGYKTVKNKIKVLIFDCDGVLFDSKDANIAFYNTILSQLQLPPMTQDEVEYVHVSTAEEALRYILDRRNPYLLDKALEYRREMDYTPFIRLMRMEPHLKELLTSLPTEIERAVSTNRTYTIGDVLRIHGLDEEFSLVVSALDVENPKPHPDSIMKILHYFSIFPSEALFVGDSGVDQVSAQRAQVIFVAYKNQSLNAEYHIDDLLHIREIIDWRKKG